MYILYAYIYKIDDINIVIDKLVRRVLTSDSSYIVMTDITNDDVMTMVTSSYSSSYRLRLLKL